jgi:methionine synthase II (cobalamin-independent)
LTERACPRAKIQITGPLTSQWALKDTSGKAVDKNADLTSQIYQLVLARAIAMSRRVAATGAKPILFLDEPVLYLLNMETPGHLMRLQELRLLVQTLKKENVEVGLHCCSNTRWGAVLSLELDYVSLDTNLSLESLLNERKKLEGFLKRGGKVALGVIPTNVKTEGLTLEDFKAAFSKLHALAPDLMKTILESALLTPACGMAMLSTERAEQLLFALRDFKKWCQSAF